MSVNLECRSCDFNDDMIMSQLVNLQNEVYKERGLHFTDEDFRFWYLQNPEGKVISFNAFDNGVMVAHQSFVPERMKVGNEVVKCLRSMAVVTHPNYRGRGIFSELTNTAVEEAKRQGYAFIYAVTNGNSFPSFIKYCGFTFVSRLNVKMGFNCDARKDGGKLYQRYWTKEALEWRLSHKTYYRRGDTIYGVFKPGVKTYMGVQNGVALEQINSLKEDKLLGMTLYVGLGAKLPRTMFNVPKFIKRSPFNLIYKDLTEGKLPTMTQDNVFYQLMDFDVT